jgi:hypothetical protein
MVPQLTSPPPRTAHQRAAPCTVTCAPAWRAGAAFACQFLGYTGFPAAGFAVAASPVTAGAQVFDFKQRGAQA